MKISVIICTCDRFEYLKKAIQAVIDQSYKDWELIIVDGGYDDNTHRMLMQMYDNGAIKFIQSAKNRIDARNKGLALAEGEYVCFLDDDDSIIRNKLEQQVMFLDSNPDVDVVSCTTLFNKNSGLMHTLKNLNHVDITELLYSPLDIDHICHFQSCLFRRSSIEKYFEKGKYFYNEFISGGEGQAFMYTLYFNGCKFANINNTIYIYNLGILENSVTNTYNLIYYNQNLLEKDMTTKKNFIMNLYNKLKGLLVNGEIKTDVETVTEPVIETTPVEEKPKKVRKTKKTEKPVVETTPVEEKPKKVRKTKKTE